MQQGYLTQGGMVPQPLIEDPGLQQQHHQHQQQQQQQQMHTHVQPHTPRHSHSPLAGSKQPLEELLRQNPLGSASSSGQGDLAHHAYLEHDERLGMQLGTSLSGHHEMTHGGYGMHHQAHMQSHPDLGGHVEHHDHHLLAMQGHAMGAHALQASMARQLHTEPLHATMYDLQRTG